MEEPGSPTPTPPVRLAIGRYSMRVPGSRLARIILGVALCIGGVLGFLPILGFWMFPLGVLVLSIDLAPVRRARRRATVRWARRKGARKNGKKAE